MSLKVEVSLEEEVELVVVELASDMVVFVAFLRQFFSKIGQMSRLVDNKRGSEKGSAGDELM